MYRSIMWPSWLKRPCGCVNVRSYGAKGDGKTDDAAAIQTVIDTLTSGGVVFLPPGVYRVESTVKLKSNVRLIGVGIDATATPTARGRSTWGMPLPTSMAPSPSPWAS